MVGSNLHLKLCSKGTGKYGFLVYQSLQDRKAQQKELEMEELENRPTTGRSTDEETEIQKI